MAVVTRVSSRRALYGKLSGDTTLAGLLATAAPGYTKAIYYEVAPSGAAFPFVVFSKASGTPTFSFKPGEPAFKSETWLVKAVDRNDRTSSADAVDAIASRLEALLTNGALTVSGGSAIYLAPVGDVDYSEVSDGTAYQHAGARYRLVLSPT